LSENLTTKSYRKKLNNQAGKTRKNFERTKKNLKVKLVKVLKGKGPVGPTCYSASYISQT